MNKIALIAIGGNALLREDQIGLQEEQIENAKQTANMFDVIIRNGYSLCVVHGNGPQVGNILIQQESASKTIPSYTLDICDAMTQGSMGFLIEQALINKLKLSDVNIPVATILTEVIVDKNDHGFNNPTKPVGPFYNKTHALELQRTKNWCIQEDSGRGYRKIVASPDPIDIVQIDAIKLLLNSGYCVIAGGGGGIPVIRDEFGLLQGVEAVIDKDRTAALLAEKICADTYIILTGVDKVALNFGQSTQRWLDRLTATQAREMLLDGQFPPGSMGPKIESALSFIKNGGQEVLITSPEAFLKSSYENVGTRIVTD